MPLKYLFINILSKTNNIDFYNYKKYENIHINFLELEKSNEDITELLQKIKSSLIGRKVYIYSSRKENIEKIKNFGLYVHYCFVNEEIMNIGSYINEIREEEVFWVIDRKILSYDLNKIIPHLKKANIPLAISFSGLLIKNEFFDGLRDFVVEVHKEWKNPLYYLNSYVENWVDDNYEGWKDNDYISTDNFQIKKIMLGLFGDVVVEEDNVEINNINLQKNKECLKCQYFKYCKEVGFGFFMNKIKENKCVGVKIFNLDS